MEIPCEQCGHKLPYRGAVCPKCGSKIICLDETMEIDDLGGDGITIKGKDKAHYKSPKHPNYKTIFIRKEWNYDLGEYVIRLKDENRLLDKYREIVKRENGEIIHDVDGKLSEHLSHGTAKKDGEKK